MPSDLATYQIGDGPAVLRMPYPHGYTMKSTAEDGLTRLLLDAGRRVLTFDPPGAYRSTRPLRLGLDEMVEAACETLDTYGLDAVDVVGHSMGGLCAIALGLAHPERVRRMVLVGAVAGGPSIRRGGGIPYRWPGSRADWFRFIVWGLRLSSGRGSLALHKAMVRLIRRYSFANPALFDGEPVEEVGDRSRPAPRRDRWPIVARRLDLAGRLATLAVPALVCVGRYDLQAPLACAEELALGITGATLRVFEHSGHYPFLEEPVSFAEVVDRFLA